MTYDKEVVLCFGISFNLKWSCSFQKTSRDWLEKQRTKKDRAAIFLWNWNENAQTKQKQQTNGNRAIWLLYRTDTNVRGFWLVKRTFGWKNFMPGNFLEINQSFALTSYCNTIGQLNNAFFILGFSLVGNRRVHVLFIHWLIKQITLTETIFQGHTKIDLTIEPHSRTKELFFSSLRRCQNMGGSVHCYFFVYSSDRRCPLGKQ